MDKIVEAYIKMRHQLLEMAQPTEPIKNMTFWHGTSKIEHAKGIAENGINVSEKTSKGALTPVLGAAYITPHLHYAMIYGIGGDIAGTKHAERDIPTYGEHGYVFKISGNSLKDVQPDEDSIGQLVGENKGPSWLHQMASKHITDKMLARAKNGEYSDYARIGKNLVKKMSDSQKIDLISNHGAHVAHIGKIVPDNMYRFHRNDVQHMKKDGSNFFDYAQEVKEP